MKEFRLCKADKLCSTTAIDILFSRGGVALDNEVHSAFSYPIRTLWRVNKSRSTGSTLTFLISIPKKRIRKAVDRVKMRRRIREAFRLNKNRFAFDHDIKIDMAFIYVAEELKPYDVIENSVCRILSSIHKEYADERNKSDQQ